METELRQLSDDSQYSFPGVGALWQRCAMLALAGVVTAASVDAQRTPEAHAIEGTQINRQQRQPHINAVVTLRITDSTIAYALDELARQAGVRIVYNNTNPVFARRIRVNVTQSKVSDAFVTILRGTGLVAATAPDGETVVIQLAKRSAADSTNRSDSAGITITGRVIDSRTQRGIPGAIVQVSGVPSSVISKEDGGFVLSKIAPGTRILSTRVLGYKTSSQTIVFVSGVNENVTVSMQFVPQNLREVVTTGAGDRQRLEVGNSSALINADSIVKTTPLRDISDLIKSRAPGTQVISSGGTAGAGSRIRIRGVAGLITNSDPILIVDGVRLDMSYSQAPAASPGTIGARNISGNQVASGVPAASRLNDIDPELIESIEVLKGPSAATLYGSDAANGVIVIKTKRGRPGPARWSVGTTQGMTSSNARYPEIWTAWGSSPMWAESANCSLMDLANKRCEVDSLTHFNPLNQKETSPLGKGYSSSYMSQLSGGSPFLQYFIGGTYNYELGVLRMPSSEVARLSKLRGGAPLPEWAKRPNEASSTNLSLNLNSQVNPKLDVGLTSMFMSQARRDAAQGAGSYIERSLKGPGYRDTIGNGWGVNGPAIDFMQRAGDASDRIAGGLQGAFRPSSLFMVNGLIGMDRTTRNDEKLLRQQDVIGLEAASVRSGRGRSQNQTTNRNASLTGTASLPLRIDLQSRSVIGMQFQRMDYASMGVEVEDLQDGSDVLSGGTVTTMGATEVRNALATLGWFADQSASFRDALFVTAAIRADAASSFGTQARPMIYPKFNASWLISRESFFPSTSYLTSLRLRGAFGQAGVQPGTDARFRSFGSIRSNFDGIQVTGFNLRSLGNTGLVPERSIEYEAGFDLSLWNDRMTFDVTRYQKTTNDALVARTLPPSFGFPSRQENVGKIRNSGLEISTSARPVISTAANWNVTLAYSKNSNKLMKLSANSGVPWGGMRYVEGYPVNAFWARPIIAYNDNDGNGILTPDEVKLADSAVYIGQTIPKMEFSLHSDLGLMNGRVTIGTGFNYQGGLTQFNSLLNSQCGDRRCRFAVDPSVSLAEQLYAFGSVFGGNSSAQVVYDRVSWMRWSDLSVTVHGTPAMARIFRGRTVSLSLMGRNLALWSKYRGADPEVNTSNLGNVTADGGAIPQTREWSMRFNLSY